MGDKITADPNSIDVSKLSGKCDYCAISRGMYANGCDIRVAPEVVPGASQNPNACQAHYPIMKIFATAFGVSSGSHEFKEKARAVIMDGLESQIKGMADVGEINGLVKVGKDENMFALLYQGKDSADVDALRPIIGKYAQSAKVKSGKGIVNVEDLGIDLTKLSKDVQAKLREGWSALVFYVRRH